MFSYNLFFIAQCTCTQKEMKKGLQSISIAFKELGPVFIAANRKMLGKFNFLCNCHI